MKSEHRLSPLLQPHLHFPRNTWLQYIAQRQLQAETINVQVQGFGASYIRDFTVDQNNTKPKSHICSGDCDDEFMVTNTLPLWQIKTE